MVHNFHYKLRFLYSTGMTIIGHDTEASTNVGHCTDPGCYTKPIVYQASLKQITALTQLSSDCRQSIKVLFKK
jgi:contactin associated protein 1